MEFLGKLRLKIKIKLTEVFITFPHFVHFGFIYVLFGKLVRMIVRKNVWFVENAFFKIQIFMYLVLNVAVV